MRPSKRTLAMLTSALVALVPVARAELSDKAAPQPMPKAWWSLRPLSRPALPKVRSDWGSNPVDAFVLAGLESHGLQPSSQADRAVLIRRLSFDLHGLPPTPDEIDAFVRDERPDAYANLVERLLASPRYGERWGRHWLDVVHYGDTHGYDKDKRRDWAWPYRDYVVKSLNADKPYRRFIEEQIAGDVLFPSDPSSVVATGFVAAGPWDFVGHVELREGTVDKEKTRVLDRDDMIANTIATFNSLTVHCARCHDHKFDSIPQRDYYRLQAVFAGIDRGDRAYFTPRRVAELARLRAERDTAARRLAEVRRQASGYTCPELVWLDLRLRQEREERAATRSLKRQRELEAALRQGEQARRALIEAITPAALLAELAKAEGKVAGLDAHIAALAGGEKVYALLPVPPRPIWVLHRGNVEQHREPVTAGALACVPGPDPNFKLTNPNDEGARRAALAGWISDPRNPLTWRSIANRLWQYHFGRGLVDTPNDFGRNGSQPTHPELLDWLAVECRDSGGSFKKLHRLILMSATYRQASAHRPECAIVDADNRHLWRMNRLRLDAEEVRDAVLAVSGKLNAAMGGPGFELFRFKDDHSPIYDHTDLEKIHDPTTYRRTVYRFSVRSVPNPFLECLDCADPNLNVPVRNTTLSALQALALLNDPFMLRQADHFADRVRRSSPDIKQQIEAAYCLALGRPPSSSERTAFASYACRFGLASACRLIFNMNEFVFID
jgi:hypothetical protein